MSKILVFLFILGMENTFLFSGIPTPEPSRAMIKEWESLSSETEVDHYMGNNFDTIMHHHNFRDSFMNHAGTRGLLTNKVLCNKIWDKFQSRVKYYIFWNNRMRYDKGLKITFVRHMNFNASEIINTLGEKKLFGKKMVRDAYNYWFVKSDSSLETSRTMEGIFYYRLIRKTAFSKAPDLGGAKLCLLDFPEADHLFFYGKEARGLLLEDCLKYKARIEELEEEKRFIYSEVGSDRYLPFDSLKLKGFLEKRISYLCSLLPPEPTIKPLPEVKPELAPVAITPEPESVPIPPKPEPEPDNRNLYILLALLSSVLIILFVRAYRKKT